jgi:hypothetical protein
MANVLLPCMPIVEIYRSIPCEDALSVSKLSRYNGGTLDKLKKYQLSEDKSGICVSLCLNLLYMVRIE